MKALIAAAALLSCSSVASAEGPLTSHDKGWMAYFTGDSCQILRKVAGQAGSDSAIAINIARNPHNKVLPLAGQTILSVSLFENDLPLHETARTLTVRAGSKQWLLTVSDYGMGNTTGRQADEIRSALLSGTVTVEVVGAEGNSETFAVSPQGFRVANATFDACNAALLANKP